MEGQCHVNYDHGRSKRPKVPRNDTSSVPNICKPPLASELCSMSSGVTFSVTRPGYWSPANDARIWLRATFISTNENRMPWKMWRFEQFYWVTASRHPSAVWVLGDLFGYHALHKACHLPVRWPKHPRSNGPKRVAETLNAQTSFISYQYQNSFLNTLKLIPLHSFGVGSMNRLALSRQIRTLKLHKSTNNNPTTNLHSTHFHPGVKFGPTTKFSPQNSPPPWQLVPPDPPCR